MVLPDGTGNNLIVYGISHSVKLGQTIKWLRLIKPRNLGKCAEFDSIRIEFLTLYFDSFG